MTDEKCEAVRHELEALLRRHHFDWVVADVDEQIRLGKTEVEVVETPNEEQFALSGEPPAAERRRRARKDKFLRRVDYTPRERLTLVIAALEHAVVDIGEIGIRLNEFLTERNRRPTEVLFASDEEGVSPRPSPIHAMQVRKANLSAWRSLLAQLRKEETKDAN